LYWRYKSKEVAYSMNKFQVEDCILCGDTRVPCQPLINGSTDGEDGHLAVLHEGDYSTNIALIDKQMLCIFTAH